MATNPSPSVREAYTRQRALETLASMRAKGWSATRAAHEAGTTLPTLRKYAGPALRRGDDGRYQATRGDRFTRRMRMLTPDGQIGIPVRGSRQASAVAEYWNAVDRYLTTGRTDDLQQFRGRTIRVGAIEHPFITDPRTLRRLGLAGEVSFEDIYDLTAG